VHRAVMPIQRDAALSRALPHCPLLPLPSTPEVRLSPHTPSQHTCQHPHHIAGLPLHRARMRHLPLFLPGGAALIPQHQKPPPSATHQRHLRSKAAECMHRPQLQPQKHSVARRDLELRGQWLEAALPRQRRKCTRRRQPKVHGMRHTHATFRVPRGGRRGTRGARPRARPAPLQCA
jgi:hypothetical protein